MTGKEIKKEKKINEEIKELKECVKDKDKRLKEQEEEIEEQDERIEKIESRHSTTIWSIIIIAIIIGFGLLGFTMAYVDGHLPDAVSSEERDTISDITYSYDDPLQYFGFWIICILAFVGYAALLIFAHTVIKMYTG